MHHSKMLPNILNIMISIGLTSFFAATAVSQTHLGMLRVTVTDPSGASIPEVSYRLTQETTTVTRSGIGNTNGTISVAQLQPGQYRLELEVDGYRTAMHAFSLAVDERRSITIPLELGPVNEQVTVSADNPSYLLERSSVALGTVIDEQFIQDLPLDGRNFLELALLAPGTARAAEGSAASIRGDFSFTANGAREDANSFMLDGAYNVDQKLNTPGVRPPVDAIAEFKVQTNGYDASFGRHAGAQVNIITKSGSNNLHGTAYGFFRSQALNGTNFFAPKNEPNPTYDRTQAGFSIGGPIVENRTFFFADYEGTRLREGITRVTNVPTLAERQGDFSSSLFPTPINPFTGQSFPGNQIPSYFQHPVGQAIAARYPTPNRTAPFANYVSSPLLEDQVDHFDLKIDHHFSNASSLTARYSRGDRRLFDPFSGAAGTPLIPGYGARVPRQADNLVISETHVLSNAVVNDVRVVYNRVSNQVLHENQGVNLNQQVGLPNLSQNSRTWGLSQINLPGFSSLGDESNNPQNSTLSTIQILDTVTFSRGSHLFTMGGDLRFTRQDGFRDVQSRGFLNFTGMMTGNPLSDLLLGLPTVTGGATLDNPQQLRAQSHNFFIQDSIQIRPDVTLSAGLRYELNLPPFDANDRASVYDTRTGQLAAVGANGVPRGGYDTDKNNLAPRLGLTWSLTPDTVVRGGYGIFYDQSALSPGEGLYFNPPLFNFGMAFQYPGLPPLTLTDPFPTNFPIPTAPTATTFQRDLKTAYLQQWHTSIQHQLGLAQVVEIAYVGSRGHNLLRGRDVNQPLPSAAPLNLRPNPMFADIIAIESAARSRYHSLQLQFRQRLRHGLTVQSGYTVGKSEDDASGFFTSTGDANFPQDHNNPQLEYGRSAFDIRHRFSMGFSYLLPTGNSSGGWASALVQNWQLSGTVELQSGRPFTVALLPTTDNSNTGRAALGFGFNDRPNLVGNPKLNNPSETMWFNTNAFTTPPFGNFGNAGRNILDGPGFRNVNLALLKNIPIGGDLDFQFRIEAFNLLNTVNFGLPDAFVDSPTFGQILAAGHARRVQMGIKLIF